MAEHYHQRYLLIWTRGISEQMLFLEVWIYLLGRRLAELVFFRWPEFGRPVFLHQAWRKVRSSMTISSTFPLLYWSSSGRRAGFGSSALPRGIIWLLFFARRSSTLAACNLKPSSTKLFIIAADILERTTKGHKTRNISS